MSKRYKLLKDLPDGQTSGTEYYLNGNSYYPLHINDSDKGFAVHRKWVENNPSWFQEIIDTPREWEILRVKHKVSGLFRSKENFGAEWEPMVLDKIEAHEIVSVKRLSDGEVFSVGDKIAGYKNTGIKEIKLYSHGLRIITDANGDGCSTDRLSWDIGNCIKLKKETPENKEEFVWTDELVENFIMTENCGYSIEVLRRQIKGFKNEIIPSPKTIVEPEGKERIEVSMQPDFIKGKETIWRCSVEFRKKITADKLPLIKAAIEETINDGWLLRYTQEEMDEAIMDAFKNARLIEVGMVNQILFDKRLVHKTVHDYIKSLTNKTPI